MSDMIIIWQENRTPQNRIIQPYSLLTGCTLVCFAAGLRYKEDHMMYYHIAETLKPIQAEDVEVWEKIAGILKPEEIEANKLPPMLLPPDSMLCAEKI